jgi:hypothetical protein
MIADVTEAATTPAKPPLNLQLYRGAPPGVCARVGRAATIAALLCGVCAAAVMFVRRRRQKRALDSQLDQRLAESFPASDPVAQP